MSITYLEKERTFKLDTPNTSYVICIVDKEGFVGHAYYGKKLEEGDVSYLLRIFEGVKTPESCNGERLSFYDRFPQEYPTHGIGDFRESALRVEDKNGAHASKLTYKSHKIFAGKKEIPGLPSTWSAANKGADGKQPWKACYEDVKGGEKGLTVCTAPYGKDADCYTLELRLEDKETGFEVVLSYTVFDDCDAIVRSARVINTGSETLIVRKAMSASLDMDNRNYDKIELLGSWAREREIDRTKVSYGIQGTRSGRGEGGHQEHAFTAVLDHNATQTMGDVYGFDLIYSGNFRNLIERSQFDQLRIMEGINPEDFSWQLLPGEKFYTPEAVLVYSSEGIGGMSRAFHDLYRKHLIRGKYRDKKRPILINNWEATYFNFNTEKLLGIAKEAGKLGIEMFVMDDGWFGKRDDDKSSLGDWFVNEEKIKGGLPYLVDEVNKLGMKFGIWFEPEMISEDSELYRKHPDWAFKVPGRTPSQSRNQYVLDISRPEVADHQYAQIAKILHSANIEYVKWDMNRPLSDVYSQALPKDRQGEVFHRYVMGVYSMQERLVTEFPDLLLENCSGGGARFDAGMLYYSPQIWCSDDADAIERLKIQEGTALIYPLSTMGAHVSACPNHTVGRVTPFETRGRVALAGTFGYELDVTKLTEEEKNMIPEQVKTYHKYNDLVREGDYYRIASTYDDHTFDAYMVTSKDKSEALVTVVLVNKRPNMLSRNIKLQGLAPEKKYRIEEGAPSANGPADRTYLGSTLMNAGIQIEEDWGDYKARLIHVVEA
ncbi:MAG: alpha-galactosidase [Lachnospiraceae bacterium]|nr:alpha-galactosidase [Lachnospiraceae bacterium]